MPERKWEPAPFAFRWVHIDGWGKFYIDTNGTEARIGGKLVMLAKLFPRTSTRVEMS